MMTPQTVNAVNLPVLNAMNFPAAFLQAPFFDPAAPLAVNYGAIGAVIGHEISHSFDDQGSQFDASGKFRNWWSKEDFDHFKTASAKLVAQYNTYRPLPDLAVNGQLDAEREHRGSRRARRRLRRVSRRGADGGIVRAVSRQGRRRHQRRRRQRRRSSRNRASATISSSSSPGRRRGARRCGSRCSARSSSPMDTRPTNTGPTRSAISTRGIRPSPSNRAAPVSRAGGTRPRLVMVTIIQVLRCRACCLSVREFPDEREFIASTEGDRRCAAAEARHARAGDRMWSGRGRSRDRTPDRRRPCAGHRPIGEGDRSGESCGTQGNRRRSPQSAKGRHRGLPARARRSAVRHRASRPRRRARWPSSGVGTNGTSPDRISLDAPRPPLHRRRRPTARNQDGESGLSASCFDGACFYESSFYESSFSAATSCGSALMCLVGQPAVLDARAGGDELADDVVVGLGRPACRAMLPAMERPPERRGVIVDRPSRRSAQPCAISSRTISGCPPSAALWSIVPSTLRLLGIDSVPEQELDDFQSSVLTRPEAASQQLFTRGVRRQAALVVEEALRRHPGVRRRRLLRDRAPRRDPRRAARPRRGRWRDTH